LEACILDASISNPFIPKLWTVLREDYGKAELRGDLAAGLTVAVVALPLSMAIAIASGVTPGPGTLYGHRWRIHRLGARGQPVSDRGPGGRLHCPCSLNRAGAWG
jgi:hypothetical protein